MGFILLRLLFSCLCLWNTKSWGKYTRICALLHCFIFALRLTKITGMNFQPHAVVLVRRLKERWILKLKRIKSVLVGSELFSRVCKTEKIEISFAKSTNFLENFSAKAGRGEHGRADKNARARAVKSSNHRFKMMASFTFDCRLVLLDCLQFSNQLDRSDVHQGQQCQQNSSNLKTYVGNLFTWRNSDVVNKRNKGKWMISFHRILSSLWLN